MPDESLVRELVRARETKTRISRNGVIVPKDIADAARIQAEVLRALNVHNFGWKVGREGDLAVAAPIVLSNDSAIRWQSTLLVELEIAVTLKRDLPVLVGRRYSEADVIDATSHLSCGFELVEQRFEDNEAVFLTRLADSLSNQSYILGETSTDLSLLHQDEFECAISWNNETTTVATRHPFGSALRVILEYANAQFDHLGGLRAGQVITTGNLAHLITVDRPGVLSGSIKGLGKVLLKAY